jgi:hypothetical protein
LELGWKRLSWNTLLQLIYPFLYSTLPPEIILHSRDNSAFWVNQSWCALIWQIAILGSLVISLWIAWCRSQLGLSVLFGEFWASPMSILVDPFDSITFAIGVCINLNGGNWSCKIISHQIQIN